MIELHAWLTIWPTYMDEDIHTEINEEEIYKKIDNILNNQKYNSLYLVEKNGPRALNVCLYDNRQTAKSKEIIDIFTEIAKVATGSYGVLYLWDDEDVVHNNEFQLLVARKGNCYWIHDQIFSTCDPRIFENI